MNRILAAFVAVALVTMLGPSPASGQDPIQVMKARAAAEDQAQARAQALEAQKAAKAREILKAREALTGREPFAPAFITYWLDRLSKLSLEQLEAVAALGPDSNLLEAVTAAESRAQAAGPAGGPALGFGDSGANLVFTKVPPCRIIDSRLAGSQLVNGTLASYEVAGATGFSAQGGTASGCGVPLGATAAALNFTVTQTAGPGNLRAWPYGESPAAASIINYKGANTLANGLIVPICDPAAATCTYDLTLTADVSDTHVIVDVMGYFTRPAGLGGLKSFTTEALATSTVYLPDSATCVSYPPATVTVNAPGPGEIVVRAKVNTYVNHAAGVNEFASYTLHTAPATCSFSSYGHNSFVNITPSLPAGVQLLWDNVELRYTVTTAGPVTFYLNGAKLQGGTNSMAFYFAGVQATFHAQ